MKPENGRPKNPEHLIGGYATGSLSPAEQQALLEHALGDQALFDELMKEQALKEMLDEPGVRRELAAVLGETNPSFADRLHRWMRSPMAWSAAAAMAAASVVTLALWRADRPIPSVQEATPVAQRQEAAPAGAERELRQLARTPAPTPQRKAARASSPPPARTAVPGQPKAEAQMPATQPLELLAPEPLRDTAAAPPPPPPAPMAEAKATAPTLSYAILRGDAEGVFRPVTSVRDLNDGDRFKLTITPSAPGPLRVTRRAPDGAETPIFAANLPAGATVVVPSGTALRMGEMAAVVLEFGPAPTPLNQPMFGLRSPAGAAAPRQHARQAANEAAAPVRIEIILRK
jgi:hypothetical protein